MTTQIGGVRVASIKELKEGEPLCVKFGDKALAVIRLDGKAYVIDNTCPHAGGPLCEGRVKGGVLTCPWHGSRFEVDGGQVVHGPAKTGAKSYPTEIRGDDVYAVLNGAAPDTKPKAVTFSFTPSFDKEHPFANEDFLTELLQGLKFPFKLYGRLPLVIIAQSQDEIDAYLGEVHLTEVDLQKLSGLMKALNDKWKVDITYCIFQTKQFPGVMLLNIRGPHAPANLDNSITY